MARDGRGTSISVAIHSRAKRDISILLSDRLNTAESDESLVSWEVIGAKGGTRTPTGFPARS